MNALTAKATVSLAVVWGLFAPVTASAAPMELPRISYGVPANASVTVSSISAFAYAPPLKPIRRVDAMSLFGVMRNSTEDEASLYRDMRKRLGKELDIDLFSL